MSRAAELPRVPFLPGETTMTTTFSLVIDGHRVPVPGVPDGAAWLDDPARAPLVRDGKTRDPARVTGIVLHTSRGVPGVVRPGSRPSNRAELLARYQANTERDVSWHLTIDTDGAVIQSCDTASWMAWHAGHANGWSVGIECAQHPDTSDLWQVQVASLVAVVEVLCRELRIPRRVPVGADGRPFAGVVRAWQEASEGGRQEPWAGVLGHRNLTTHRGPGDPGDALFEALLAAGFEAVPVAAIGHIEAPAAPAAPAAPPLPDWLDATMEVTDTSEHDVEPEVFVRDAMVHLAALGVPRERALEVVAHCAVECSFGRKAAGHNQGGVKLSQTDAREERRRTGHGLPWWRRAGHAEAGDDPVCYYRAFGDDRAFWTFWLARYVPKSAAVAERDRYIETGRRFWGGNGDWFVAMLVAGYRGPVRQRELAELLARGGDPEAHPSIAEHRAVVERVRALAAPPP